MFDLGMSEVIIIAIVAVLVLGPEQMPKVLYTIGKWMRQLSYTRFAVERQFDNFMTREDARLEKKSVASETPPAASNEDMIKSEDDGTR